MDKGKYYVAAVLLVIAGVGAYLLIIGTGMYKRKPPLDPQVLHQAVDGGEIEQIQSLITIGYDVNAKNRDGWTPLQRAADTGAVDGNGLTPLAKATRHGHHGIVELLSKPSSVK